MTEQLFRDLHIERRRLQGRPFGLDEDGNEIRQVNGKLVRGAIEYMLEFIEQKVAQEAPPGLTKTQLAQRITEAQDEAFDKLVTLLNAAINDERYNVSREYLMNEGNYYSYEFEFFICDFARAICGDPDFFFHRAKKSIPSSLAWIGRPFTLQQIYNLLPRFTALFVDTDIRVLRTAKNSAVIQWWGQAQAEKVPEPSRAGYLELGCYGYQGAYATIPPILNPGLPLAQVRETTCQLKGDECCTWEFTWQNPMPRRSRWLWVGLAGTVALLAYSLSALPGSRIAAWLALFPLVASWFIPRLRLLEYENELKAQQVLEQRATAEAQYDQLQKAYGDVQIANVGLQTKISELTTLRDMGLVLSSTLNQEELLDRTLRIVTSNLNFDRAMVLLVDEERRVLTGGRMIGGMPEMGEMIAKLELPLDDDELLLARVVKTGEPVLVRDASQVSGATTQSIIAALKMRTFLSVPLQAKGRCVGALAVDNLHSARPITEDDQGLLVTLGHVVGVAIENAQLYEAVEEYSGTLEKKVALRTRDLAEEKSRLDAILHNIADGLLVTNSENEVLIVNPAFEDMFGLQTNALVGRPLTAVIEERELQDIITNALQETDTVFLAEIFLPNGRTFKALASAIQQEEDTIGVVTVLRDITHESEVDRMKTDFISMASHELRTPLTSVLGFAKLIHKSFNQHVAPKIADDDFKGQQAVQRIRDNLDIIVSEGERLTRLINDVLDVAKMEEGKVEWHMADVSVDEVIESAVAAISSLANAENLMVRVDVEEGLPPVWADRDRLIQVVTNLLSNAIKFTEEGQIRVASYKLQVADDGTVQPSTLRTGPQDEAWSGSIELAEVLKPGTWDLEPGYWLAVSVQDTGLGIVQENLPQVFEKFRQVGDVLTDRPKGTGLGLPICKHIVEHHGGRIWVDSELGVGSTFTFVLPLAAEAVPRLPMLGEICRRVAETLSAEGKGQLILVVDDEENMRNLLRQELSEAGYQVVEAADGIEALARARQERPDLIILDVMMPGISGFDVTSVLKADQATADIPILILSILEDREKGFRLGADEYLTKPLDTEKLLRSIAILLARAERGEGRKKVLIIDEDASVIETVTRVLQERGYEVVEAYDGQDGLEKARQERPDLIILDSMISKMNDYEVLRTLKYETETRDACVIVLAAATSPEEVAEILNRGADRCGEADTLPDLLLDPP